jgi:hypothetical protein
VSKRDNGCMVLRGVSAVCSRCGRYVDRVHVIGCTFHCPDCCPYRNSNQHAAQDAASLRLGRRSGVGAGIQVPDNHPTTKTPQIARNEKVQNGRR